MASNANSENIPRKEPPETKPPIYDFANILETLDAAAPDTWPAFVRSLSSFHSTYGLPWLELLPRICYHGLMQTPVGALITLRDREIPSLIEGTACEVIRRVSAASGWEIIFFKVRSHGVVPEVIWGPMMSWRPSDRDILISETKELLTFAVDQAKDARDKRDGGLRPVASVIGRRPLPQSEV